MIFIYSSFINSATLLLFLSFTITCGIKKTESLKSAQVVFSLLHSANAIATNLDVIYSDQQITTIRTPVIFTVNIYNNYVKPHHNTHCSIKNITLILNTLPMKGKEIGGHNNSLSVSYSNNTDCTSITLSNIQNNKNINGSGYSLLIVQNTTEHLGNINGTEVLERANIIVDTSKVNYNYLLINKSGGINNSINTYDNTVNDYHKNFMIISLPESHFFNVSGYNNSKIINIINDIQNYSFKHPVGKVINLVKNNWFIKKLNESIANVRAKSAILKTEFLANRDDVISKVKVSRPSLSQQTFSSAFIITNDSKNKSRLNMTVSVNTKCYYVTTERSFSLNNKLINNIHENNYRSDSKSEDTRRNLSHNYFTVCDDDSHRVTIKERTTSLSEGKSTNVFKCKNNSMKIVTENSSVGYSDILTINNYTCSDTTLHNNNYTVLNAAGRFFSNCFGQMSKMMHCLSSNDIPEPSVSNITFYLFTQRNPSVGEVISLDNSCIEDLDNDLSANNDNSNNDDYYYNYIDTDSMLCRSKKNIQEQSQWRSRHSRHPKSKDSVAVIPTKNGTFNKIKHLKYGKSVISSKYFDLNDNTKIIIHGYTQSYVTEAIVKLKNAYLSKGSFNVILVDWSVLAAGPCYNIATKYARFVGFIVSKLISQLTLGGINTKSIHIIGFSLGAQVAGFAGSNYNTGRVQRITGLDPALPLFPTKKESDGILDADDAYFVDIIHTSHILGQVRPLGHADFYPNGGFRQPGCDVSDIVCSHIRSLQLFIESVTSSAGFPSVLCSSWDLFASGYCHTRNSTVMFLGEPCLTNASGLFFLKTGSSSPFALRFNITQKKLLNG